MGIMGNNQPTNLVSGWLTVKTQISIDQAVNSYPQPTHVQPTLKSHSCALSIILCVLLRVGMNVTLPYVFPEGCNLCSMLTS